MYGEDDTGSPDVVTAELWFLLFFFLAAGVGWG